MHDSSSFKVYTTLYLSLEQIAGETTEKQEFQILSAAKISSQYGIVARTHQIYYLGGSPLLY